MIDVYNYFWDSETSTPDGAERKMKKKLYKSINVIWGESSTLKLSVNERVPNEIFTRIFF